MLDQNCKKIIEQAQTEKNTPLNLFLKTEASFSPTQPSISPQLLGSRTLESTATAGKHTL